ncbi:MAG: RIP metalloprotease RseP [Syntrophobacteraceae bacterium]|jgi:regulator of sigma E protease|nr:RIP metalloprotease RseP [Syntrophobacteraceae bacterium]
MIVSTVVVLGILIFVHELGHFLVAKWAGVKVLRFSLGFGPKLVAVTRGDTEYRLSAIPLGGYVKMLGEESEEELSPEEMARSFSVQPVWKRIGIVLAGPVSNLVLAVIIFALVYTFSGIPQIAPEIGTVNPGSPAEQAGLQPNDLVLSINDKPLVQWEDLSTIIEESREDVLSLRVQRGDQILTFRVSPKVSEVKNIFGETIERRVIGVMASGKTTMKEVSPLDAGYYSIVQTAHLSKLFLVTIGKLIQRVVPLETLGGPILIAQMAGQQASEGLINLIYFTALISVNLAVLNLLPIPVLDGGHILFYLFELILGRPIAIKKMEIAQKVGMFLLILLMLFVFYNDIMRLLPGRKPDFLP